MPSIIYFCTDNLEYAKRIVRGEEIPEIDDWNIPEAYNFSPMYYKNNKEGESWISTFFDVTDTGEDGIIAIRQKENAYQIFADQQASALGDLVKMLREYSVATISDLKTGTKGKQHGDVCRIDSILKGADYHIENNHLWTALTESEPDEDSAFNVENYDFDIETSSGWSWIFKRLKTKDAYYFVTGAYMWLLEGYYDFTSEARF